ncbi:MAG: pyridoxine 5'-phosphate synthase [Deferribacteraceae bacterium]|jgi:pyridoxine 5-phosphate synthase|nr:pyridoxine 5'-phosphate synthase [Deferribacteraceae bacterium]
MVRLGVNIDHTATLRNARGGGEPEPLIAAAMAELGGADGITVHLREDRRHIKDRDVVLLRSSVNLPLNLEMACTKEIIDIARNILPDMCTLVPEKRAELTTEGGLDVAGNFEKIKKSVSRLMDKGIEVSLFIAPEEEQIICASKTGAKFVELHTGAYADAGVQQHKDELNKLFIAAQTAQQNGLIVNAGHGLNYRNILPVAQIKGLYEVNIGHSVISRALYTGLTKAVSDMKALLAIASGAAQGI